MPPVGYETEFAASNYPAVSAEAEPQVIPTPGGEIFRFLADTSQTLLIGDYVYLSGAGSKVSKSATITNYANVRAGVVVGGQSIDLDRVMRAHFRPGDVGLTAATAGQEVYVMTYGVCYVQTDGALTAPLSLIPSATTAGKVHNGTTSGQILGVLLTSTGAAALALAFVSPI